MWPIQLAFRLLISCRIFLCSLTLRNTSSFLTWSVQLILQSKNSSYIRVKSAVIKHLYPCRGLQSDLFPYSFSNWNVAYIFITSMHATYSAHLNLVDVISPLILREQIWPRVIYFQLGPADVTDHLNSYPHSAIRSVTKYNIPPFIRRLTWHFLPEVKIAFAVRIICSRQWQWIHCVRWHGWSVISCSSLTTDMTPYLAKRRD
jgi:hypothetical protein